jgi:transmembrane sensor
MTPPDTKLGCETFSDQIDRAATLFLRRRAGSWTAEDEAAFEATQQDSGQAQLLRRVARAWKAVGDHADSPELIVLREQALTRARRANVRRWYSPVNVVRRRWLAAASVAAAAILLAFALQLSPYGIKLGLYRTGFGEQRTIELEDRSTIALDSRTKLQVRYSADARIVEISEGQAQFSVAEDAARPFKVIAGKHTIVALGTVFTVEYFGREMQVATLEGRVAVLLPSSAHEDRRSFADRIELARGEALRVQRDGSARVTAKADLAATTAWRQGQIIFHDEPLGAAVRRLNRYSRVQITVKDPELAELSISGLFAAGDTRAFANALQSYLPVTASEPDSRTIELRMKSPIPHEVR